MRRVAELCRSLPWSRLAIFAVIAVAAVSCSSESSRLTDPFGHRKSPAPGEVTGSVANRSTHVQSRPLPPPQTSHMTAPATRPAVTGVAGGSAGMASYQPGQRAGHEITGSLPAPPPTQVSATPAAVQRNWTWEGGTAITVGPGENGHVLSQRYGAPAAAIAQANGLPDAAAIKPGQRLVIPRYDSVTTGTVAPARVASNMPPAAQPRPAPLIAAPATSAPAAGGYYVHVVAPGETLMKISRQYKKSLTELAAANKFAPHTLVKVGDRVVIPGVRAPQTAAKPQPLVVPQQQAQQRPAPAPAPNQKMANAPNTNNQTTARAITPAADNPPAEKPAADTTGASAMPAFRWPVRGRVITGFGPKTTGQQNDGINVAVPEGTPIKAAADGVVAYAGNEIKTYGNLVLIRHSNGYVTAYAHASEIMVKRDEQIKRGQVIAKSGQTGNVSAPQLHFEIRKGSAPVDPIPYLDKGGNS